MCTERGRQRVHPWSGRRVILDAITHNVSGLHA